MMARDILPDAKGQINFPPITYKGTPILTTEMALSFNGVTLTPIRRQNSLWIKATELARALGYSESRKVT